MFCEWNHRADGGSSSRLPAGFTLIELLVVIAIIAILAAIIFPVFVSAKARAQQSTCYSNVRQIGLAVDMYANDNGDRLPFCRSWGKAWNTDHALRPDQVYLPELLHPYLKNKNVLKCPVAFDKKLEKPVSWWTVEANGGISYIWNHIYWDPKIGYVTQRPVSGRQRSTIYRVSKAPVLWDGPFWTQVHSPHNGGINVAYADGHAEWRGGDSPSRYNPRIDFWHLHSWEGWDRY